MRLRPEITLALPLILTSLTGCGGTADQGPPTGSGGMVRRSADTETLSGSLTEDTTLSDRIADPSVADYCVEDDLNVGSIVTIEPGVVICFGSGASLSVASGGVLIADGRPDARIRFTAEEPIAGFWDGVVIGTDDTRNVLRYVDIEYAGGVNGISSYSAGLAIAYQASAAVEHVNVSDTTASGLLVEKGAYLRSFTDNAFANNDGNPVVIVANEVGQLDAASQYSGGNGEDAIRVTFTGVAGDVTWAAPEDGTPYHILDWLWFTDGSLTIEPGARLEFEPDAYLQIESNAYLAAAGTAEEPIVFTGVVKGTPSWKGVYIQSPDPRNVMDHVEVGYGGSSPPYPYDDPACVTLDWATEAKLSLTNAGVHDCGGWAAYAPSSATLTQSNNTFMNNALGDVGP